MDLRSATRCLAVLGLLGWIVAGSGAAPSPTPEMRSALEQAPDGWKEITPKEGLAGWTRLPVPAGGTLGRAQWHVDPQTGYLICDGDGGHDWLRYDHEVGDFIYHLEWRYEPVEGKSGYNSGVYVRNSSDGRIWHQAQVGSQFGGYFFGQTLVNGAPQGFNLMKELAQQRVKPAGEWNTYEVTGRGNTLTVWVNGGVSQTWDGCGVTRGFLGVEGEGWKIAYRNLKLKEL